MELHSLLSRFRASLRALQPEINEFYRFFETVSGTIVGVTKKKTSSSHADAVETALRRAIIAAEYEPGQRLSAEALAVKFRVSPTPVREALARLAGDNLVTSLPQRGVRVASLSLSEMEEIYDVRSLIDPLAIERSVQHMNEDARVELVSHYERMIEASGSGTRDLDAGEYAAYEEAHMAFHRSTLSRCGSSWLLRLSDLLSDHSLRYRYASIQSRSRYETISEEHAEILAACLGADADRARESQLRHLENTRSALRQLLVPEDPSPEASPNEPTNNWLSGTPDRKVWATGWISTDNEHKGWAARVAPDGRLSASSTAGGMLVKGVTGHYPPDKTLPGFEVIPNRQIIGWRGQCECGWQGEMWERVTSREAADFSRRRDYFAPEEPAFASGEVEDAIHDEWKTHIAPSEAILGVEAAAREYNQAGRRLDQTVAAAKASGASWADIGRAVGISRQSAHERWAEKQ